MQFTRRSRADDWGGEVRKFTWALVSTGRLDTGEKFTVSIRNANGEPFDNPITPEMLMKKIEWLLADEHTQYATSQYADLTDENKTKIDNLMHALMEIQRK